MAFVDSTQLIENSNAFEDSGLPAHPLFFNDLRPVLDLLALADIVSGYPGD
jgi:hypothetical protein